MASCPISCKIPRTKPSSSEIQRLCQDFEITDDQLRQCMQLYLGEVNRGLNKATHPQSTVKCFVTYVQDLPTGEEKEKTLAIDLGGTNFRILLINLANDEDTTNKIFELSQALITGPGKDLFDYIAKCLAEFVKENKLEGKELPLGFCFSFPVKQTGLKQGILQRWTKGFHCSGVEGEDVVKLLEEAIARRGDMKIKLCAILNDTTGTLMACAFVDHKCRIGLIIGTGTNACYVEEQCNAQLFDDDDWGSGKIIINTEWGAFGDDGKLDFVRNEHDKEIDKHSINPGKQIHEKMISGMYMGELARLMVLKLTKKGLLFGGKMSDLLFEKDAITAKEVSDIEGDPAGVYSAARAFLDGLKLRVTEDDCRNVRYVCECVSTRAARLVSAGLATLLNKMNEYNVTVGIDGSVYRFHPHMHNLMMDKMRTLVEPHIKFRLMLSEDGSGRGAAVVAAVAMENMLNPDKKPKHKNKKQTNCRCPH